MSFTTNSPAFSIGYMLWLRLRWILSSLLLWLLSIAVVGQFYPIGAEVGCLVGATSVFVALAPLLNTFSLGPADLGVKTSGFPTHMMVLPLSARTLVGWPMLFGATTVAILWILLACLIFIPAGITMPVFWPATLLAAACTWVQALSWTPFAIPFGRLPVLLAALAPLVLIPFTTTSFYHNSDASAIMAVAGLCWAAVGFLVGVRGLTLARGGNEGNWVAAISKRRSMAILHKLISRKMQHPPFRSPTTAQFWQECRRNAIYCPLMLMLIVLPMIPLSCNSIIQGNRPDTFIIHGISITNDLLPVLFCVALPLFMSGFIGPPLGKFDIWGKEQMPAFFAIRPLTTPQLVTIKFAAAAMSALAVWALVVLYLVIWAGVEASPLNPRASYVRSALNQLTPKSATIVVAGVLAYFFFFWLSLVTGMWITLTGRKWLSLVVAVFFVLMLTAMGGVGYWVNEHPEIRPTLVACIPWFVGALVVLKAVAAAGAVAALQRLRLASSLDLTKLSAGWVALAVLLFAGISAFTTPTLMLAAGVFLLLPFTRLAVAPVALHFNRHR